ncbi:MAG: TlpA disulfide reductase family protein [Trueperaceae bacterium]|nr:TlpA disulfide reductase family protein [Trueperaceae bacterium]
MTVRPLLLRHLLPLVLLAVLTSVGFAQRVGAPLPGFELRDQHGVLVGAADLRGQPLILNVWASWCPPCRAELPLLAGAAADLADDGVVLLLLNAGETAAVATEYLAAQGLALRTLVDPDRREPGLEPTLDVLRRLRTGGLPTTYFVDGDGVLRGTYVGELDASALATQLASALGVDWSP